LGPVSVPLFSSCRTLPSSTRFPYTTLFRSRVAQRRAFFVPRFVDDVPRAHAAAVVRHDLADVAKHRLAYGLRAVQALHPPRELVVPHEGVPLDLHAVALREGRDLIARGEVEPPRRGLVV